MPVSLRATIHRRLGLQRCSPPEKPLIPGSVLEQAPALGQVAQVVVELGRLPCCLDYLRTYLLGGLQSLLEELDVLAVGKGISTRWRSTLPRTPSAGGVEDVLLGLRHESR